MLRSEPQTTKGATHYDMNNEAIIQAGANQADDQDESHDRGTWGHKAEFMLSCIGLSVGLGNVWRFPYLAFRHGGAAFLIAYLVLQILIGKPMYFMELVMGQYSAKGPTGVWEMNPSAKGIGISMAMISLVVAIYYNVIMAYTLFYFFASMQSVLPWSNCDSFINRTLKTCVSERLMCTGNVTLDKAGCICNEALNEPGYNIACVNSTNFVTAPALYFDLEVTQKSPGLEPENIGAPLWRLALCLLLSWLIVVACLYKGVKSSGKVVYFTATFPYIILLILLIRGCTMPGAIKGIKKFIIPDWEKFTDLSLWVDAAGQMFFSLSVCFGGIMMFGSYNKFNNNIYIDSLIISVMDLVTSIIAGFVIFSVLGGLSTESNVEIDNLAKGGFELAFVVYPEALARLPIPHLWSILFFFMLFILGLDSEFGMLETVLTCIQDEYPGLRKYKGYICLGFGVCCFFFALPCVCPGGTYVVSLLDGYAADFSVLCVASCELIAVMWVYGARRFINNVQFMIGYQPHPAAFWIFCWTICSPILISMLFVYRMIRYKPPKYDNGEVYPEFAQIVGWLLSALCLCPIPLYCVYRFIYEFLKSKKPTCKNANIVRLKGVIQKITTPTEFWRPAGNKKETKKERKIREKGEDNYGYEGNKKY
ncbi:sodiumchlorideB0+-likedependent and chloride-dependent neutral and basic amino acid transporter B0+- [Octopus vulgaris]|uniref:Transporter n=1 Tax=Octopus vulgaris TaxID=6645 RepID=A0AA36FB48_OCTVU|nr:sodiumchlorideB0+-likedependent and chloride-dependent neutral and basic amino acid transporter B0+- [Octopus vulgaris]